MKAINFTPRIDLILKGKDLLVLTNFYTKPDNQNAYFKSDLIKLLNFDEVSEISLVLDEGFDTLQGDEAPFMQGKTYIRSKTNGVNGEIIKTLIEEPHIPILQTKVKNKSVAFQELRQSLINKIHEEFYQAINSIEQAPSSNETHTSKQYSAPPSFLYNLASVKKLKYLTYGIFALAFSYMGLGLYEKKISVDNQVNSSLNLSMDAKQLTQNDDQAMDKMFREIGIDRNALSSDLSCFSE